MHAPDVLIVSLGSTSGLRVADEQLREALERAGASVTVAVAESPRPRRTLMLTDLAWATAARRASERALKAPVDEGARPRAIVYSSVTAALLWRVPGAIRFDALSAANRLGRHGLWQRPLERLRLRQAPLLLPWSQGALAEVGADAGMRERALVLPVAVEPSGAAGAERDIAAITYGANPSKKGLDRVIEAWGRLSSERARGELLIAGIGPRELERSLPRGLPATGVRALGALARDDYRALLRRARVFVCAPRREDYGIAQLEALADGCMLVTAPAQGPYAALPLARALDPRLVSDDLAAALRTALEDPPAGYAERALAALAPYRAAAVQELVSAQLLARLLGQRAQLAQ